LVTSWQYQSVAPRPSVAPPSTRHGGLRSSVRKVEGRSPPQQGGPAAALKAGHCCAYRARDLHQKPHRKVSRLRRIGAMGALTKKPLLLRQQTACEPAPVMSFQRIFQPLVAATLRSKRNTPRHRHPRKSCVFPARPAKRYAHRDFKRFTLARLANGAGPAKACGVSPGRSRLIGDGRMCIVNHPTGHSLLHN
jgi:hypothetical protein